LGVSLRALAAIIDSDLWGQDEVPKHTVSVPVQGQPRLFLSTRSGKVTVVAESRDDFLIETNKGQATIEQDASGRLSVTAGASTVDIDARCPAGTDVIAGTNSGRVELVGDFGGVRISTGSGGIAIDRAKSVDARTTSGSIVVRDCGGRCRMKTVSGRAEVASADRAEVATTSGRISVEQASGDVRVRSTSGTVDVGSTGSGDVEVDTISGAVTVRLPPGVHPDARLETFSGKPRCECDEGSDCCVVIRTMSGDIRLLTA
jgi:DUF4097 and DUF4098 domain-containing protein YvlB